MSNAYKNGREHFASGGIGKPSKDSAFMLMLDGISVSALEERAIASDDWRAGFAEAKAESEAPKKKTKKKATKKKAKKK